MLNVMIVDDETIARDDLKNLIDWETYGFRISAEASNGINALKIFQKNPVDLIITDITMPVMDGLKMAEKIIEKNSTVKFIFLTAYEDFDFARKAMRLGINSYIIKHEMDEQTIVAELNKIKREIYEDIRQKKFSNDNVYKAFFSETVMEDEFKALTDEYFRSIKNGNSVILIIDFSDAVMDELLKERLITITKSTLEGFVEVERSHIFCFSDKSISILLNLKTTVSYANTYHTILHICNAMQDKIMHLLMIKPFICVSRIIQSIDKMQDIYLQAMEELKQKFFYRVSSVIFCDQHNDYNNHYDYVQELEKLNQSITDRNYDMVRWQIEDILLHKIAQAKNHKMLWDCLNKMIAMISNMELFESNEDRLISTINLYKTLSGLKNIYGIYDYLIGIINEIESSENNKYSLKMKSVIDYINHHYHEDITLQSIADLAGVSATYMSQLFKHNIGISFKHYLVQVRIEKAKEMLSLGKYKIYEVGEKVGFHSTQYFCTTFKQITGITPKEYIL